MFLFVLQSILVSKEASLKEFLSLFIFYLFIYLSTHIRPKIMVELFSQTLLPWVLDGWMS